MDEYKKIHTAMYDELPVGIILVSHDQQERIIYHNKAMLQVLQCENDEDFSKCTNDHFKGLYHDDGIVSIQDLVYSSAHLNSELVFTMFETRTFLGHIRRLECVVRKGDEVGHDYWLIVMVNASDRNEQLGLSQKIAKVMSADDFYKAALRTASEDKKQGIFGIHVPLYLNLTNFRHYNELFGYEKGNRLLDEIAYIILEEMPDAIVTHSSADNFLMLANRKDLTSHIEKICHRVNDYIDESDIVLKVGIRYFNEDASEADLKKSFDEANLACMTIKSNPERMWAIYDPQMEKQAALRRYIMTHFESALENHDIDVYYQPIIRSLSQKVCGIEALARWEDRSYGMIMPGEFIPVLEEAHKIAQLDRYIVERSVKDLAKRMQNDEPIVPVSFNFSHLDFGLLDLVSLLDDYSEQYHIPRDYLRVDISEKGVYEDHGQTLATIESLRQKSYHVSMDHFGRGYASLELLKRYAFDEIKLDIQYMMQFDEKTRQILSSLVTLAKEMGIHTLAQGVETREQYDFLKKIGCEKVQGYFYAPPMKGADLLKYCFTHNMPLETALEAQIYDRAGLVSLTGPATAIYYSNGKKAYLLVMNELYQKAFAAADWRGLKDNDKHVIDYETFMADHRFVHFMDKASASDQTMELTFFKNNVYFLLQVKKIAGPKDHQIFETHLFDIAYHGGEFSSINLLSHQLIQDSVRIYEGIYYADFKTDQFAVVRSLGADLKMETMHQSVEEAVIYAAEHYVYREDRQHFLEYMNKDYLFKKAKEDPNHEVIMYFRMRHHDASFAWYAFICQVSLEAQSVAVFMLEDIWRRQLHRDEVDVSYNNTYHDRRLSEIESTKMLKGDMFDDLIDGIRLPVYWKDRHLRYLGANSEFLKMHGLKDVKPLLGKTDAELGWRINENHDQKIERQIVNQGESFYDLSSVINAKNRPSRITESKIPFYSNGHVQGLISIYSDNDDIRQIREDIDVTKLLDHETGLLTYRGILGILDQFDTNYHVSGINYSVLLIDVFDFARYAKAYGKEIRAKMLKKIVAILSKDFYADAFYARTGECRFLIITKQTDTTKIRESMLKRMRAVHEINDIDGCSMTLYLDYGLCQASEAINIDQVLNIASQRLDNVKENQFGESLFVGDSVIFNLKQFDDMTERIVISDVDTHEIVYINKAYLSDMHLPSHYNYRGMKCYKFLYGRDSACETCDSPRLSRDCFTSTSQRNLLSGIDYITQSTLIPWRGKDYRFTMSINISEYLKDNRANKEFLYNEIDANDAIRMAIEETDPEEGIRKMIERIAINLEAERFFIFEENDDGSVSCTYEWETDSSVSMKEDLQNVPRSVVAHLYDQFNKNEVILVPNTEKYLLDHPGVTFKIKGIKSFVSGYLQNSEKSYGYTEVINPSPKTFKSAKELLTTLTWFITLLLRNRDNMKEMQRLTNEDQLTGVLNRRGFEEIIKNIPDGTKILAIFADINGLKHVNDTYGHREGDALIQRAAQVMIDLFDKKHVFRMGGDEFLLYKEIEEAEEAEKYVSLLKASAAYHHVSLAIGSSIAIAPVTDINAFIKEVDKKMYEDKGRHYHRRSTDRQP